MSLRPASHKRDGDVAYVFGRKGYGYLRVTVDARAIHAEFTAVDKGSHAHLVFDRMKLDLAPHKLTG